MKKSDSACEQDSLLYAAKNGDFNSVKLFAENGYRLKWQDNAFLSAAENGHFDVVRLFVEAGVEIQAKDNQALRHAAMNGYFEIVKLLVKRRANIHANNDEALRLAAKDGYFKIVELLIDAGANIRAVNDQALRFAAENGYSEIVQLLIDKGANIHAVDSQALRHAVMNRYLDIVQRLNPGAIIQAANILDLFDYSTSRYNTARLMEKYQDETRLGAHVQFKSEPDQLGIFSGKNRLNEAFKYAEDKPLIREISFIYDGNPVQLVRESDDTWKDESV